MEYCTDEDSPVVVNVEDDCISRPFPCGGLLDISDTGIAACAARLADWLVGLDLIRDSPGSVVGEDLGTTPVLKRSSSADE